MIESIDANTLEDWRILVKFEGGAAIDPQST